MSQMDDEEPVIPVRRRADLPYPLAISMSENEYYGRCELQSRASE